MAVIGIHLLFLTVPLFTLPIFIKKDAPVWLLKVAMGCSVITLLGMAFGIYGRMISGLLVFEVMPQFNIANTKPYIERVKALGVFASWGASYPLLLLIKKTYAKLSKNSFVENMFFSLIYFYGLHLVFSVIGILILKLYFS